MYHMILGKSFIHLAARVHVWEGEVFDTTHCLVCEAVALVNHLRSHLYDF